MRKLTLTFILALSTSMIVFAQEVASTVKLQKITIEENKYTTEVIFALDGNSTLKVNSGRGTNEDSYISVTSDKTMSLLSSDSYKMTYWDMNNVEKKTLIYWSSYKISGMDFGYVAVLKDASNKNITEVLFTKDPYNPNSGSNVGKRSYQFQSERRFKSDDQDFEITEYYQGSSTGYWSSEEIANGKGSYTLEGMLNLSERSYDVICISK